MGSYEKIIQLCKKNEITPTALERELGFSNGSIGKARKSAISSKRLEKIAEYFGVSMDYLQDREGVYYYDDKAAAVAQDVFDNPDLQLLFDAAKGSRPEDLQMAADLLRRLKGTNPNG